MFHYKIPKDNRRNEAYKNPKPRPKNTNSIYKRNHIKKGLPLMKEDE